MRLRLADDLDNTASDVRQFSEIAAHEARSRRYGEAAASARRAAEYAERAARAARELADECETMPPHLCEVCDEVCDEVDEQSVCTACGSAACGG